ncbi:hypothetical protein [Arhodomonas sp. SL1]|uniref:hypothetical protein n=1 Tax=Arhodomonas sp. SL1 TaxID=3425691 RepID=UPI003F881150
MSADSMFWAGMAGGRFQKIQRLNDTIDEWTEHAARLERARDEAQAAARAAQERAEAAETRAEAQEKELEALSPERRAKRAEEEAHQLRSECKRLHAEIHRLQNDRGTAAISIEAAQRRASRERQHAHRTMRIASAHVARAEAQRDALYHALVRLHGADQAKSIIAETEQGDTEQERQRIAAERIREALRPHDQGEALADRTYSDMRQDSSKRQPQPDPRAQMAQIIHHTRETTRAPARPRRRWRTLLHYAAATAVLSYIIWWIATMAANAPLP